MLYLKKYLIYKYIMEYDFAIVYWGLPRSIKKTYTSHINNIYNILENNKLTYKKFMHTWKTKDNKQTVSSFSDNIIQQEIDYDEYKLLSPDFYKIESQEEFLSSIDMNKFFYKEIYDTIGHNINGEWLPYLIRNHLCALESQKRCLEMVEEFVGLKEKGNKFKYIIFVRPDALIHNELLINEVLTNLYDIHIPDNNHWEGYNDRFAIINYENAYKYGKRINEIEEFRKKQGRIVSEKYVKFIIEKYNLRINKINFNFDLIRP